MNERLRQRPRPRWVAVLRNQPASPYAALGAFVLFAFWATIFWTPVDATAFGLLFAVPVFLIGLRFGGRVGAAVGIAAALLAGPLGGAASGAAWTWVAQGAVFVVIGVMVGSLGTAYERELEREREIEHRERALSSQRVALVQIVSHELRTPLTVIRGSMETLRSRPDAVAPRFRGLVDATQRSASRLEEMVGMMLAAADDLDEGLSQLTDVPVEELVHHAAISIREGVDDRLHLDMPAGARVETVEAYLWLTLRCLLDNAIRFSPVEEPIDVSFVRERDRAIITLRDHGPGLPEGFEELAFEPFTQGDASLRRSMNGLGMGLYTARRLARRLGGDIELQSEEHEGVTARVLLPQPSVDLTTEATAAAGGDR